MGTSARKTTRHTTNDTKTRSNGYERNGEHTRFRMTAWVAVACVLLFSACTRRSQLQAVASEPPREGTHTPNEPWAASPEEDVRSEGYALGAWPAARDATGTPSQAKPRAQYHDDAPRAAAERRPGLATSYGERRESPIIEVPFVRFDEHRPSAWLSLFYDDESGVEWKTGRDADDARPSEFSLVGGAVEVSIVSSWDNPLPSLYANGRAFIIGDSSDRYAIRLTNHSRERYEVVASVDGLDVITGTEATFAHHGYILAPWSTLRIEGFRESADTVRAFRFGDLSESYAVGRGFGRDIGVIGVALFGERRAERHPEPNPFPGRFAPPPSY